MYLLVQHVVIARQLEHHEGKFASGRQYHAQAQRLRLAQPPGETAQAVQQRQLDADQHNGQQQHV
ncbi:hypothetical protein D9M71_839320 [compost metagenome]